MFNESSSSQVPLSLDAQLAIDELCDAFETRLRGGEEPRIEQVLAESPETYRRHLFRELRKLESEYRRACSDADYRQRFPEYVSPEAVVTSDLTTNYRETVCLRDAELPVIPGYEILSKLGEGGMGVVFKARQQKLDRVVALKMMRAGQFAGSAERQRFRFEAEAIATLDHANIVPVYDVGEWAGDSFLCLKYVEGGSLADQLKQRRFTPPESATLTLAITRAVQHAHERGFLHRDLKPGNILLDAKGKPHVADFGLARRLAAEHSLTPTGAVIGTLHYMAPEQARGERGITVTADVYALGAILYELLTGVPPIHGATYMETLSRLSEGSAIVRPRLRNGAVPIDLEAICLKCLEHDPALRYPTAAALANDLDRFLHNEPVSAQPPGIWDWLVQAMRTRPQPSPEYTWPGPIWIGGLVFAQQLAVFALVETAQPIWMLWTTLATGWLAIGLVIWLLLLRRFRQLPITERHTSIVGLGQLSAQIVLLLAIGPRNWQAPSVEILPVYPPLMVVSGLCFFILGSTNWGRFLPIGLAVMPLAMVTVAWPRSGPLLLGAVVSFLLIWWGLGKYWYFVRAHEPPPTSSTTATIHRDATAR